MAAKKPKILDKLTRSISILEVVKGLKLPKANKKADKPTVPSLRSSFSRSFRLIRQHRRPLALVTLVYGILYFIFVRVLTHVDIADLRESVILVFGKGQESLYTNVVTVGSLFGESTNLDNQSGLMFAIISVICSLALIWVMRFIWAGRRISVKDSFYQGMYPLVPLLLVLLFMFIQALPFSISTFLFQTAFNNSLTSSVVEKLFFVSVLGMGIIISGYYMIGSVIASYAVTVPKVSPSEARRTAKKMLAGRRFLVLRQVLIYLLITSIGTLVPMLLVVWQVPQLAVAAAASFIVLALPWMHLYFYGLYRDLLDE